MIGSGVSNESCRCSDRSCDCGDKRVITKVPSDAYVGVQGTAATLSWVIHAHKPKAKVILGGAHATAVNAAQKQERNPGRATVAMMRLLALFDVLVAGDGEKAVLVAIGEDSPKIVDADDPASPLFLTATQMDDDWPARNLVDVDSYEYEIEALELEEAPFDFPGANFPKRIEWDDVPEEIQNLIETDHSQTGLVERMFSYYDR